MVVGLVLIAQLSYVLNRIVILVLVLYFAFVCVSGQAGTPSPPSSIQTATVTVTGTCQGDERLGGTMLLSSSALNR